MPPTVRGPRRGNAWGPADCDPPAPAFSEAGRAHHARSVEVSAPRPRPQDLRRVGHTRGARAHHSRRLPRGRGPASPRRRPPRARRRRGARTRRRPRCAAGGPPPPRGGAGVHCGPGLGRGSRGPRPGRSCAAIPRRRPAASLRAPQKGGPETAAGVPPSSVRARAVALDAARRGAGDPGLRG